MSCCYRFLDADYRRPLILQELLGFNADIICLQEVDEKAFAEYFHPQLQQAGALAGTSPASTGITWVLPHACTHQWDDHEQHTAPLFDDGQHTATCW